MSRCVIALALAIPAEGAAALPVWQRLDNTLLSGSIIAGAAPAADGSSLRECKAICLAAKACRAFTFEAGKVRMKHAFSKERNTDVCMFALTACHCVPTRRFTPLQ